MREVDIRKWFLIFMTLLFRSVSRFEILVKKRHKSRKICSSTMWLIRCVCFWGIGKLKRTFIDVFIRQEEEIIQHQLLCVWAFLQEQNKTASVVATNCELMSKMCPRKCLTRLPASPCLCGSRVAVRSHRIRCKVVLKVRSRSGSVYYACDVFRLSRLRAVDRKSENAGLLIYCHLCHHTLIV